MFLSIIVDMIIDSHCHLNYLDLNNITLKKIINNAKNVGIDKIVSVSVVWNEINNIKNISRNFRDVYFSVGVHPNECNGYQPKVDEIIEKSKCLKCIAIGETGLDYYNNNNNKKAQMNKFAIHIQAANQLNKPVIVHSRAAKHDTLSILKSENIENCGGILHCFTEDYDMAKKAIDMMMYISFSGILTFNNARNIQEVAKKIPLDRILIETDAPYLSPVPFRGKTNYPEYLKYTAYFLANLKNITYQELSKYIYQNSFAIFKF